MSEELVRIPLGLIVPSPHNPRTIRENDPAVAELAESIKAHGLLQPVVCRTVEGSADAFELLAGRRRFEAHKLIGAEDILAIVRDLDDQAAIEVTVLENLQREDLSPLEEARGVRELAASGRSYREIADRIGKTPAWCARRAVLCDLSPAAVAEFEKPSGKLRETTIQHLELFARLPAEVQERWLAEAHSAWMWAPRNLREFQHRIAAETRKLRGCAWDAADATLYPEAGACETCMKRSSRQPELWGDDADPKKLAKNERCLDGACYMEKLRRQTARRMDELKAEHPNMIRVIGEIRAGDDAAWDVAREQGESGALREYQYKPAQKGTKGAVPALVVCGAGAGAVKWVIPEKASTNNRGRKVDAAGNVKPLSLAEKRKGLECRRQAWVIGHVADALAESCLNRTDTKRPFDEDTGYTRFLAFAAAFGTASCHRFVSDDSWKRYEGYLADESGAQAERELWGGVADTLQERLKFYTPSACKPQFDEALRVANLLGLAGEQDLMTLAEEAIPEPKSWAKEKKAPAKKAAGRKKGAKKA